MRDTLSLLKKQISKNPLLTRSSEIELANRVATGDKKAREKLIESNYRLAVNIATNCYLKSKTNLELQDIVQESTTGLIKAVDRFNPNLGNKFSTYATWWISQAAQKYINENKTIIKVPQHARVLNGKIKKASYDYRKKFNREISIKELATLLEVPEETIKTCNRIPDNIVYIGPEKDDDDNLKGIYSVPDSSPDPETSLILEDEKNAMLKALATLKPREEMIIRLRKGIFEVHDIENYTLSKEEVNEIKNT
jgi:RNA polymerase primary sigma factor